MSDHVLDELTDFVASRLAPERRREVQHHVKTCEECSSKLAWVERLRDEALCVGMGHMPAMRIAELSGKVGSPPTEVEREHLASCAECRQELDWAEGPPGLDEVEAEPTDSGRTGAGTAAFRASAVPRWAWFGLAAAAVLTLIVILPRGPSTDVSDLARIKPLPVEITRSAIPPDSFGEATLRGYELYAEGDYAAARESLLEASQLRSDDAVNLYLASAELLLGRPEEATARLRSVADRASDLAVREEALWQLANALLASGQTGESEKILQQVVENDGLHRADAAALLAQLRAPG